MVDPKISFWEKHKTIEEMQKEYHIQDIFKFDDFEQIFKDTVGKEDCVYLYNGVNPYSGIKTLSAEDDFKVLLHIYIFQLEKLLLK